MPRLILPVLTALLLVAAAPASAQVLSGSREDAAERPADPGRDIQSIASTYDPAGTWTVHARFYGAPTAETSALLRVFLGERAPDGACVESSPASTLMAVYTDPADRGGKGFVDNMSVNVVKTLDADGRGFTVAFTDERLAGRPVCGVVTTSLSRKEPFDSVGAFEFPGAPAGPASPPPGQEPVADTTPPSARLTIVRDPRAARRGVVRASLVAATEPVTVRATLYGPAGALTRRTLSLSPGQELRLSLPLGRRALKRLRSVGRLPVRVVAVLQDAAGNAATVRASAVLRHRR